MLQASIYKDPKGYIICPLSKTEAGFGITTDPFVRVYNSEAAEKLIRIVLELLSLSRKNIPTPKFNTKLTDAQKLEIKIKCKNLKIKSMRSMDKYPFLLCDVSLDDEILRVRPWHRNISHNGNSYIPYKDEKPFEINFNSDKMEILKTIEMAFARCEIIL
jgi:hypothetical protein